MNQSELYEILHVSRYSYASVAHQCVMQLCLQPREDAGQQLLHFKVETLPTAFANHQTDCFGNTLHVLNLHAAHEFFEIRATSNVRVPRTSVLVEGLGQSAWKEMRDWRNSFDLWDFMQPSRLARGSPLLEAFIKDHQIEPCEDPLRSLTQLSVSIHDAFEYDPGSTTAESPIEDILKTGHGVCQDYAHVMISIARGWGVPTRYVSGYLYVGEDSSVGQQQGDAHNATHAWIECLLPGLGWVGFDPTNPGSVGGDYVRIAAGRDYADVSPTHGVLVGGGEIDLKVSVDVRRAPRA